MSTSRRRTLAVVAAGFAVAVVLVWASVTGPRGVVGLDTGAAVPIQTRPPQPTASPEPEDRQERGRADHDSTAPASWGSDLLTVAGLMVGLWLSAVVVRGIVLRISRRLPDKRLVVDVDTLPDGAGAEGHEQMAQGAARQREALVASDVRNGIVRCWVLLEEAAAHAGVIRLPADTATEFVVRFLHALDVDPRPVDELERLFHEARFSTHPLTENHRERALHALDTIHDQLAVARA